MTKVSFCPVDDIGFHLKKIGKNGVRDKTKLLARSRISNRYKSVRVQIMCLGVTFMPFIALLPAIWPFSKFVNVYVPIMW